MDKIIEIPRNIEDAFGDAFYIYNRTKEKIITLKDNLMWKGTIVAIRMPYSNIRNFDYSKYLE